MSAEKIVTEVALSAISSDIKEAIYNTLPDVVIPASSICSFDTGISAKLKNCACDIQGSQDLNGYTKPWAGGTGKNLVYEVIAGANINSDGSIASGQPYALACAKVVNGETYTATSQEAQFVGAYFTDAPAVGSTSYDGTRVVLNTKTITAPIDGYVVFRMPEEYTTLPQLEVGSSATSYEPYENFCPLTAYTEANITRCGVNLWDESIKRGYIYNGNYYSSDSYWCNDGNIPVKPNTTYTFSGITSGGQICFYDRSNTYMNDNTGTADNKTFTTPSGCYYISVYNPIATEGNDKQLEVGSSPSAYHAYTGNTYTIAFGQTVYGGQLDVTSGKLTVTWGSVDLGSLNWAEKGTGTTGIYRMRAALDSKAIPNNQTFDAVCEKYVAESANATYSLISGISGDESGAFIWVYDPNYNTSSSASAFKTSVNGTHLAYELASPAVYNLTANEITALLGNNVIFADVGDTALTYKDLSTRGVTWKDITGTLSAGSTSITLSDDVITTSSTIDVYTDTFGINPTNMTATTGSVTLTFEAQASDLGVKVRVS